VGNLSSTLVGDNPHLPIPTPWHPTTSQTTVGNSMSARALSIRRTTAPAPSSFVHTAQFASMAHSRCQLVGPGRRPIVLKVGSVSVSTRRLLQTSCSSGVAHPEEVSIILYIESHPTEIDSARCSSMRTPTGRIQFWDFEAFSTRFCSDI